VEERSAWLDEVCGSATPLRARIEALLDRHQRAHSFLKRPAVESESIAAGVRGNDVDEALGAGQVPAFTRQEIRAARVEDLLRFTP
jgi:hypothetical protein